MAAKVTIKNIFNGKTEKVTEAMAKKICKRSSGIIIVGKPIEVSDKTDKLIDKVTTKAASKKK